MPLDPSIYDRAGQVNLGAGLSDVINQQRQRENEAEARQNSLSVLLRQQQLGDLQLQQARREAAKYPAQQAEEKRLVQVAKGKELNTWLSSAVQSGRPQDEIIAEAIAKGQEIGVAPDATQRHVISVFQGAKTPQERSDYAFMQANPELVAKQRAEAMFRKPEKDINWTTIQTEDGVAQVNPQTGEIRQLGVQAPKKEKPVNWATLQTDKGIAQVNPQTGEIRQLGVQAPPKGKGGPMTEEQITQAKLTTQQTLDQLGKLYKHPGRAAATGASSFMSMVPASYAKSFSAELKTFQSKAFLNAVEKMKGLGALTEIEGEKLVSSIGALDPSMKEEDFAENIKSIANEIVDNAKAKGYDVKLPEFISNSTAAHPSDINDLLNKYKVR